MKIKEFEQNWISIPKQKLSRDGAHAQLFLTEEKNTRHQDNERLEFLRRRFFDAVISVELYERLKHVTEGKPTKTRALIVCESALAQVARGYELGNLNLGHGEDTGGGRLGIQFWLTVWKR